MQILLRNIILELPEIPQQLPILLRNDNLNAIILKPLEEQQLHPPLTLFLLPLLIGIDIVVDLVCLLLLGHRSLLRRSHGADRLLLLVNSVEHIHFVMEFHLAAVEGHFFQFYHPEFFQVDGKLVF